jgi:hypothetical protein
MRSSSACESQPDILAKVTLAAADPAKIKAWAKMYALVSMKTLLRTFCFIKMGCPTRTRAAPAPGFVRWIGMPYLQ